MALLLLLQTLVLSGFEFVATVTKGERALLGCNAGESDVFLRNVGDMFELHSVYIQIYVSPIVMDTNVLPKRRRN
jgi:hypothetical protein